MLPFMDLCYCIHFSLSVIIYQGGRIRWNTKEEVADTLATEITISEVHVQSRSGRWIVRYKYA